MDDLLKSLNSQRKANILCDVVLVVQNEEFSAHKGILAANSNYFMAMFTTNMLERKKTRIDLKEIAPSAVKSILDYIYTGELNIDEEKVRVLLEASNFLLISSVKQACCQFLEDILEAENCLTIMSIAEEFFCEELYQKASRFLYKQFQSVAKHKDFMNLRLDEIVELLSSDEIHVDSEEQLVEILAKWVSYDLNDRKRYLLQLFPLIRFDYIQPGMIDNSLMCTEIAEGFCTAYLRVSKGSLAPVNPRKSYSSVPVLLVVGGVGSSRILETVSCYVPSVNKWCKLGSMNVPRWRLNVINAESTVLAVGGLQEVSTTQQDVPYMEKYDPKIDQWKAFPLPNLPFPADCGSYKAVLLEKEIIFIQSLVDFTLRDPRPITMSLKEINGKATFVALASIPRRRTGHCIVSTSSHVYVIGGSLLALHHGSVLGENTVERYDRKSDSWTTVSPMNQPRYNASAVSLNDQLFVFGGSHRTQALRSAEVYNPETNQWRPISPMSTPRINAGIAVYSGKIWVIGGKSSPRGSVLSSIECYNPGYDRWSSGTSLPDKREYFTCCMTEVAYKIVSSVIEDEG